MNQVRQFLNRIAVLSDEEWHLFSSRLRVTTIKKGEILIGEGEVSDKIYFISSGLIRLYVMQDGKDICRQFFFEDSFFSEYQSFLLQQPSQTVTDALEDTELYYFTYADMQEFYKIIPQFQLIGRIIAENLFLKISERVNSFLTQSPELRYQQLITNRPKVLQRIPQYMIASYLGITPEHLSRIRKKISSGQG